MKKDLIFFNSFVKYSKKTTIYKPNSIQSVKFRKHFENDAPLNKTYFEDLRNMVLRALDNPEISISNWLIIDHSRCYFQNENWSGSWTFEKCIGLVCYINESRWTYERKLWVHSPKNQLLKVLQSCHKSLSLKTLEQTREGINI